MFDANSAGPETEDGEQATLDLLTHGTLDIEGRLVDASNATLYCTIETGRPDPRPEISPGRGPGKSRARQAKSPKKPRRLQATIACVY